MAKLNFNEAKATQVAALLIQHRGSNRMKFLKLIKLMYLVDREALTRWGRPVTTDHHVSMDKGPVLSNVYRLINEEPYPGEYWSQFIARSNDYDVELVRLPGDDELSAAEEGLIAEVFETNGHKNRWQLVEELHSVPEWRDPHGSMIAIELRDILSAVGRNEEDIASIEEQTAAAALASHLFEPV